MNKKKILKIMVIIICIWLIFFVTDVARVKLEKRPIFSIKVATYNDGGSIVYAGIGYKVIHFKKLVDCGTVYGQTLIGVNYYYIGLWITTFDKAWKKIEDKAVEKSREEFKQYLEEYGYSNEKTVEI